MRHTPPIIHSSPCCECQNSNKEVENRLSARRSQNGFTLVEMLVTLALLGLIAMLSFPYLSGGKGSVGLTSDARVLASRFRAAREMAIATRSKTAVIIDIVRPGVRGPGSLSEYVFTTANHVSVTTARGMVTGETAPIMFSPDGGSSGGEVMLDGGSEVRRVRVEWLTGAVNITGAVQ
jgi:general secretion pathway protein H